MTKVAERKRLTQKAFAVALERAGISAGEDDRAAMFETASWLDNGLARLEVAVAETDAERP